MGNKKMTLAAKVRRMIDRGMDNKEIAKRLNCKIGYVYSVRWHMNRKSGLGALVPKKEGTGIEMIREFQLAQPKPEGGQVPYDYAYVTELKPRTWWQRFTDWLRG